MTCILLIWTNSEYIHSHLIFVLIHFYWLKRVVYVYSHTSFDNVIIKQSYGFILQLTHEKMLNIIHFKYVIPIKLF